MADQSDKALDILIRLGILGKEDLVAFKGLMAETGQSAEQLSSSLSMPEGWQGMEKYKGALQGANEAAAATEGHLHSLRSLMSGAGPEAAELGHLLHFAFNPTMLGGAALAGGMELYFKWLERSQEKQREMNETLQKHNEYLHEILKAGGNIYEQQQKIGMAIAEATAKLHSLTDEFERFEARDKQYNEAQNDALNERIEKRKAESAILQEQITMLEQMGAITKPQAEQAKIEVEHKEKLAAIQDKLTKDASDYNSAKTARDTELAHAGGLGAFSPSAIGKAESDKLKAQADYDQATKDGGEAGAKEIARLKQAIEENKKGAGFDPLTGQMTAAGHDTDEALQKHLFDQEQRTKAANENLQTFGTALAKATQHLDDIKGLPEKFNRLDAALGMLGQKWVDDRSAAPTKIKEETQRAALEKINALEKGNANPASIFANGIAAMERLSSMQTQFGHGPDWFLNAGTPQDKAAVQADRAQVAALGDLESALGLNGDEVLTGISKIVRSSTSQYEIMHSLQGNIDALSRKLGELQGRAANARTAATPNF